MTSNGKNKLKFDRKMLFGFLGTALTTGHEKRWKLQVDSQMQKIYIKNSRTDYSRKGGKYPLVKDSRVKQK